MTRNSLIIFLNLLICTSIFSQTNYVGDWFYGNNIFSFKEGTLAIIPFQNIQPSSTTKEFETKKQGDRIVILQNQVAFDTLQIVSASPTKITLYQYSNNLELDLRRASETIAKNTVEEFLTDNFRYTERSKTKVGTSYAIYNVLPFQDIVNLSWEGCNKEFSFEVEEFSFGSILIIRKKDDGKDLESRFLLESIDDAMLVGKSFPSGNSELLLEKIDIQLTEWQLEQKDFVGKYQLRYERLHHEEGSSVTNKYYYRFKFDDTGIFEFEDTDKKSEEFGKWKLIRIDKFSILSLTFLDSEGKDSYTVLWLIEDMNEQQMICSDYDCDLDSRELLTFDRVE